MLELDLDLLELQASEGNADSFGQMIRIHDNDLRGVAWAVIGVSEKVDDIMQIAYEKAFRLIDTFDGRSSMKTWLYSITYRTALNYQRHENVRRHDDIDEALHVASKFSTSDQAIDSVQVTQIFSSLNQEQKILIMMTYCLGFSFQETADIIEMKKGTVASKISRAKSTLLKGLSYE